MRRPPYLNKRISVVYSRVQQVYRTYFHRRLKKRINRKTAARPCNIEERMFSKMQFLKWSVYSPVLFSVRTLYFPFNEDYPKLQQFNMVGSFNLTLKTRKTLILGICWLLSQQIQLLTSSCFIENSSVVIPLNEQDLITGSNKVLSGTVSRKFGFRHVYFNIQQGNRKYKGSREKTPNDGIYREAQPERVPFSASAT